MRLLLDSGALREATDPTTGNTPLIEAALQGFEGVVQTLLDMVSMPCSDANHGALPNCVSEEERFGGGRWGGGDSKLEPQSSYNNMMQAPAFWQAYAARKGSIWAGTIVLPDRREHRRRAG